MQIYCVYNQMIYKCDEDGYFVIRAKFEKEYIVCINKGCSVPETITMGTPLLLEGTFRDESKNTFRNKEERTFIFTAIDIVEPKSVSESIEYLKNMDIDNLSENVAIRFVETFGTDIDKTLKAYSDEEISELFNKHMKTVYLKFEEEEKERESVYKSANAIQGNGTINPIKRNPPKRAVLRSSVIKALRKIMEANNAESDLYKIFCREGVTYPSIHLLYKKVFEIKGFPPTLKDVAEMMKEPRTYINGDVSVGCYRLCREAGIDFLTADKIGKRCKYLAYTQERVAELCVWLVNSLADNGHTWSSIDDIYNAALYRQRKTAFPDTTISKYALYSAIRSMPTFFRMEEDGKRIFNQYLYRDENEIASCSIKIANAKIIKKYTPTIISEIEAKHNIKFSAKQRECFNYLQTAGLKIITGGAGTGKTTVISGLIEAFTSLNPSASIALCAPTGRAAQRMTELCKEYGASVKASTIHKLLEITPCDGKDTLPYNPANPLPYDMIIVDEMSMVGVHLCAMLFQAIRPNTLVILCGDYDQLPSVDAGKVFRDMIESKRFEVVRLSVNYRQASGSSGRNNIIYNANKINSGETTLESDKEFEIITCNNDEEMQEIIIKLIKSNKNQTVLTTVKSGSAGTKQLNKTLQPIINTTKGKTIEYGGVTYGVGDTILMTHNDYSSGYVNGDIGKIISIEDNGTLVAAFGNERKELPRKAMQDIALAYAMTIHKSQGSEYENVVIALPSSAPHMLVRNLLYTAVTRAKKKVSIVSENNGLEQAINRNVSGKRRTSLKELLERKETEA